MKVKKIPQRKCIGCNSVKNKKELIRLVRSPEGVVSLDFTGKKPGRGAYICKNKDCIIKVCKERKIERSLGVSVDKEILERLLGEFNAEV